MRHVTKGSDAHLPPSLEIPFDDIVRCRILLHNLRPVVELMQKFG